MLFPLAKFGLRTERPELYSPLIHCLIEVIELHPRTTLNLTK